MKRPLAGVLLGMLLVAGAGAALRADNPRISIKLENVTAAEATAALGKAGRVKIVVADEDPQLQQKSSFDWSNTTLASALRQLTARYGLRLTAFGNQYSLAPDPNPRKPAPRVGAMEKNGVRVFVRRIDVSISRSVDFEAARNVQDESGSMSVQLGIELPDGNPDSIVGLENITAKDDQGNILAWNFPGHPMSIPTRGFPDELTYIVGLPAPGAKTHKLLWLEGEVIAYRVFQKREVELSVSEKGKAVPYLGGTIELARAETVTSLAPGRDAAKDFSLEVHLSAPGEGMVFQSTSYGNDGTLRLFSASGKEYTSGNITSRTMGSKGVVRTQVTGQFPDIPEPITRVIYSSFEKSDPRPLAAFRIVNIPLPDDGAIVARRNAAPQPGRDHARARPITSPFTLPDGGGTLVSRVAVGGNAAPEGTLAMGLAAREGDGWSAVRWQDVTVTTGGLARLEHLKPGTYRLLRTYRPEAGVLPLPAGGQWQNSEITVTVTAGKEVAVPPLLWAK